MEEQSSVLIVDDEKNIRLTLSHSLKPMGFDTETAITGEEALEKIENKEFKLVLLDIKLPLLMELKSYEKSDSHDQILL
mgnify:CR=1 FL=1